MSEHRRDRLRRVFRLPASRARIRRDVEEELRFHIEGRIEELMARGYDRAAAETEARRRFGDYAAYLGEASTIDHRIAQERRRMDFVDSVIRETRQAARVLARSRGFTTTAVLTLALALGAATAIFTLLDAVVLRPLPYPNADRLVHLSSPVPKFEGDTLWGLARHEVYYFLEHSRTLENLGVYQTDQITVMGEEDGRPAERARYATVTATLLETLGFRPIMGRLFTLEDNLPQQNQVVILGHDYWQRRFGARPDIVGRSIDLSGDRHTVVGVVGPGAHLPDRQIDVWVPAPAHPSLAAQNNHTWQAIGLLRQGFTAAEAEADLAPLTARLPELFPNAEPREFMERTGFRTQVRPLRDVVVGDVMTRAIWVLFGAVLLVLVIAAANLSNLFMVRYDARRRETAVRAALGAEKVHFAVQFIAESVLIAVAAVMLAVAFAHAGLRLLLAMAPTDMPRLAEIGLGWRGAAFATAGALVISLALGLIPLFGPPALNLSLLKEGGRGATASRRRHGLRGALVVSQVALSVVLLAAAGLMVRSFWNLRSVDPGFDPSGVLTMNVSLPSARYRDDPARAAAFYRQLAERIEAMPGVVAAGFAEKLPLVSGSLCTGVTLEQPDANGGRGDCPPTALVSPGFFEAMGMRVQGSTLTWEGLQRHTGDMVASRAFVARHWPGESPVGKGVRYFGLEPPFYRIAGVVDDVLSDGLDQPPMPIVYFPVLPIPGADLWDAHTYMHLAVRTETGKPRALTPAIRAAVSELEPGATIGDVEPMESIVAESMARRTFTMLLLGTAAAMAVFLSVIGLYGVISYIVGQRRGEIAIRMALGAGVSRVSGMVLMQTLRLSLLGVLIGAAGAIVSTRVLESLLFGVSSTDPVMLALAGTILLAVAVLAGYGPARRAASVEPADALRAD